MSLRIGLYMRQALAGDAHLSVMTGGRIYPVIAPLDGPAGFPYIVFASDGMEVAYTKDGEAYDTQTVEVLCFGKTLEQAEETAQGAREAMRRAWPIWNESDTPERPCPFLIQEQTMRAGAADFDLAHDGYYLPLIYTIETCTNF